MVHDSVWLAAEMPKSSESHYYLCIRCLEQRLGRTLTPGDFTPASINQPDRWHTPRLNSRLRAKSD